MTPLAVPVAPWPTSCKRESIPPPGQQLLTLLSMLPHGLHTLGGNRSLHLVNYDSPCCPCCPMASILQEGIDPTTWSTNISPCCPCCPWPPSCRRAASPPSSDQRGGSPSQFNILYNVVIIRTRVRIMVHDPDPVPGGKNL